MHLDKLKRSIIFPLIMLVVGVLWLATVIADSSGAGPNPATNNSSNNTSNTNNSTTNITNPAAANSQAQDTESIDRFFKNATYDNFEEQREFKLFEPDYLEQKK
jgi:hypothetical protein